MHVTPTELRVIQRGSLILRFADLGPVAGVLAELPASGSLDTTLEDTCQESHWGVGLRGRLEVESTGSTRTILPGTGFYIPGGPPGHRFFASGPAIVAGFVPLDGRPVETVLPAGGTWDAEGETRMAPADPERAAAEPAEGQIRAEAEPMGGWIMTRAEFGPSSGFGSSFCDVPHWGVALRGSAAVEHEDDVEVLGAGDFFYLPPGPPGHRIEVADSFSMVDFTPVEGLRRAVRLMEWRETIFDPVALGRLRSPAPGA
jgi:hypothetical protein